MSDSEFNANQARNTRRTRPLGLTDWQWNGMKQVKKNERLVSAKLTPVNWMSYRSFLAKTSRNHNSAINYLVATHPELQEDA